METWPEDGIDFSDEAVEALTNASDEQMAIFHRTISEFGLDSLDVYGGFDRRSLSMESRKSIQRFLRSSPPINLYIETPFVLVELRRRASWGFRIARVTFLTPTYH